MQPPLDPRLRSIVQLLQRDPRTYSGYGWLWWPLKAILKAQVSKQELYLLGDENRPELVSLAQTLYGSADEIINQAIDHYQQRAMFAQLYAHDDHLPDGRAVQITDDDAGHANL